MKNIKYSVSLLFCVYMLTHVWLFVTPWPIAHKDPWAIKFSRQEHYSRLPFPLPGDFPDPGIKPVSPASHALAGGFFTMEPPGSPLFVPAIGKFTTRFCLATVLKKEYVGDKSWKFHKPSWVRIFVPLIFACLICEQM